MRRAAEWVALWLWAPVDRGDATVSATLRAFRRPRWLASRLLAAVVGFEVWTSGVRDASLLGARLGEQHVVWLTVLDVSSLLGHAALVSLVWWAARKIEPTRLIVIDARGGAVLKTSDPLTAEEVERIRSAVGGTVRRP